MELDSLAFPTADYFAQSLKQLMLSKPAGCVKKQMGILCLQFAFSTAQLTMLFSQLEMIMDYGWGREELGGFQCAMDSATKSNKQFNKEQIEMTMKYQLHN